MKRSLILLTLLIMLGCCGGSNSIMEQAAGPYEYVDLSTKTCNNNHLRLQFTKATNDHIIRPITFHLQELIDHKTISGAELSVDRILVIKYQDGKTLSFKAKPRGGMWAIKRIKQVKTPSSTNTDFGW